MSRRNNRNKPHKTRPSERNSNGNKPYLFTEPPPRPPLTDVSKIRNVDDPDEPAPEPDGSAGTHVDGGSRVNSLRAGLRSRILFPELMLEKIDALATAYADQFRPLSPLAEWLVWQLARGSVQSNFAGDQLIFNLKLSAERAATGWDDARREEAQRLGATIAKAPYRVAQTLGRSKFGALYLIEKLSELGDIIDTNGGLDDQQRTVLLDLLAVDPVFRNGCKVPAGHDGPGLALVVAKEKAKHAANIERNLNLRDRQEQKAAEVGIVKQHDKETRNLRADLARRRPSLQVGLGDTRAGSEGLGPGDDHRPGDPQAHRSRGPRRGRPGSDPPRACPCTSTSASACALHHHPSLAPQPRSLPFPTGVRRKSRRCGSWPPAAFLSQNEPPSPSPSLQRSSSYFGGTGDMAKKRGLPVFWQIAYDLRRF